MEDSGRFDKAVQCYKRILDVYPDHEQANLFIKDALPPDFHDRIDNSDSLDASEYDRIVRRHNRLCREIDLQYLWSCLRTDEGIFFTTATSPTHDIERQDHARFFEKHGDPHAFDAVFSTMQPDYSSFRNEWGHGRMVLVPFRDSRGRAYCFGASMSIDSLLAAERDLLTRTSSFALGVTALALLGTLLISRRITHRIQSLTRSANRMKDGNLSALIPIKGPAELRDLARALNAMQKAIADNIAALTRTENEQRVLLENLSAVDSSDRDGDTPTFSTATPWPASCSD